MEQLFEILVPVIIAAVYFFSNVLNKKSDEEEGPRAPGTYDEEDGYAERQRRIQEEIRRKILERRQAQESPAPAAEPELTPADHRLRERRRETQERVKHSEPEPVIEAPQPPPMPMAPVESADAGYQGFSWDESDNVYEQQMEAQLQRIEATKREAEALRKKAAYAHSGQGTRRVRGDGLVLRGPVREQLTNPASVRAAIIYSEVLGKPKALQ